MSHADAAVVLDMLKACRLWWSSPRGLDKETFLNDARTQSAVLHQLLVLAEAANRLSDNFRWSHPGTPWRAITGMRDMLIHHYDAVDLDEVWRTASVDVPQLVQFLESI
jgi:uncharacterized protein with HEPN domain